MAKTLTRRQVEVRKAQAVRFTRDVLGDPERAEEIERESLEAYAQRRKIQIVDNPGGVRQMATKEELQERISELEDEVEKLQDQIDEATDILAPPEEEEGEGEADEETD